MTLLTVIRDVCTAVGVAQPVAVFSGITGNRTMQEMVALANEMAQRIAYDQREWRHMKATHVYAGDGVATAFTLPPDFNRMLLRSDVWLSWSTQTPALFIPDANNWMQRRARGYTESRGEWTLIGNQMRIEPVMPVDVTASFAYLHKNCVALSAGGYGDIFQDDGDSFVIGERLLKLGMIWQWKASKGSPYAEDMSTYNDALSVIAGSDSPAPTLVGRYPTSNAAVAYPWPVPS